MPKYLSVGLIIKEEEPEKQIIPDKSPTKRRTPSPAKKKTFKIKREFEGCSGKQIFRKKWLELSQFKHWLVEGLLPYHGFCSVCNINITAGKSELLAHSKSKKHLKNLLFQDEKINTDTAVTAIVDESGSTHLLYIIDLRCDSLSVPSKEMRYAMIEAVTGDTSFGSDTTVKELEESVALMLNKESGLFFPTHVMANLVAVLTHCQSRGSAVIAGEESDISVSNKEALIKFGGLHFCPVTDCADGTFNLEDLELLLKTMDLTFPLSCLVCFECAHARKGGRVPSLEWVDQLGAICSFTDILLHCDGTRLINASLSQSVPPSRFVKDCESVTVALDKGLGAPIGAVLVGKEVFIKRAAFIRNFLGGNIHQAGTFAAAGTFALDQTLASVDYDHEKAKAIAVAVARENSSLLSVDINNVQTNIVHIQCKTDFLNATQLKDRLSSVSQEETDSCDGESVIALCEDLNKQTLSLMVHNNLSQADIRAVIKKLQFIIREYDNDCV